MAISTLGAYCLAMNVVGLMAGEAVRWRLAMFLPGVMAIAAGSINVFSMQLKVSGFVFEC